MWAGGTKVEFGWEIASRGDLAARMLVLVVLAADLARREVRLRVGAMVAGVVCWCSKMCYTFIFRRGLQIIGLSRRIWRGVESRRWTGPHGQGGHTSDIYSQNLPALKPMGSIPIFSAGAMVARKTSTVLSS